MDSLPSGGGRLSVLGMSYRFQTVVGLGRSAGFPGLATHLDAGKVHIQQRTYQPFPGDTGA